MDMEVSSRELLNQALGRYTQAEIARKLKVTPKTIRNWIREEGPPEYRVQQLHLLLHTNTPGTRDADFTFIDLFAGIGGIRLGFQRAGGRCVFTSEWNKYAVMTYSDNFKVDHEIAGDITKINENDIPDHDVLLAGFPCQPFSIAGVSKKNALGRKHGFLDETQGTLFFDVARIIKAKQPRAIMLENVKNLKSHDKGRTYSIIKNTLEQELGYKIYPEIIDAKGFVPQHRERIYIVGFREDVPFSWNALASMKPGRKVMKDILHPQNGSEKAEKDYTLGSRAMVNKKYVLSDKLWKYLYDYAAKHKEKGNGFGYGLVNKNDTARTLSARYYKDGSEILVARSNGNPRRLTPRECARLMGYPDDFRIPVSDTQAYKQFGNSVVVPVVEAVAKIMKPHIMALKEENEAQVHQYALPAA